MGYFDEMKITETSKSGVISESVNVIDYINITQKFENGRILFDKFNLSILDIKGEGQFTTILGRSGCGKCFSDNTHITIRNKKTSKIEEITIKDFLKHFLQP